MSKKFTHDWHRVLRSEEFNRFGQTVKICKRCGCLADAHTKSVKCDQRVTELIARKLRGEPKGYDARDYYPGPWSN